MSRYLDPKNDFIFKAVFANHPDLLISFLNGLLPLPEGREIVEIEYLPFEQVPDTPLKKDSIVDVKCRDNYGRIFIVEMQMYWTPSFDQRLTFNASKAYVRQLEKGRGYNDLKPVYALAILNDIYDHKTEEYYHRYQIANRQNPNEVIESMEFVLVELPKFVPDKMSDRRMAVLWLRFLKEMSENTTRISEELVADPHITKAIELCERAAFTEGQLNTYEAYWDAISLERTRINDRENELIKAKKEGEEKGWLDGMEKGLEKGLKEGLEKGVEEGIQKGLQKSQLDIAQTLLAMGMPPDQVSAATKLRIEEVLSLNQR